MILKEFTKESKYYWLLEASNDLFPFDDVITPKERIVIYEEHNINLKETIIDKFYKEGIKELIIIDRWIVTLVQFQALEKIIEAFGNPTTTIITQEVREKQNNRLIEKIIERNNITKIEKVKKDIVHQRYWKIDDNFYQTSESLDFLSIEKDKSIHCRYITFDLYDREDLDSKVLELGDIT